jgi:hypothetical protein
MSSNRQNEQKEKEKIESEHKIEEKEDEKEMEPISPHISRRSSLSSLLSPHTSSFIHYIEIVVESLPVTILMALFTIWALFSDDIRLAATSKEADLGFMIVITIAFFLFGLELIAGCLYKEGYLMLPDLTPVPGETVPQKLKRLFSFGSFYFWLDVLATVSLLFEVILLSSFSFLLRFIG